MCWAGRSSGGGCSASIWKGPFISTQDGARGAHNAQWVRKPDVAYLKELIDLAQGTVRLITIAADQEGAEELSRYASSHGVAVALGHHMAKEQDLERLVAVGAKALTHLGNGVPALLSRHQNPVWAGLANDDLAATIIADGHHLPPSMLKTFIRTKGPGRCIVISDASPLAGLPPGEYWSMGATVHLQEDGKLFNPATGYMAGSSATILACANHLAQPRPRGSERAGPDVLLQPAAADRNLAQAGPGGEADSFRREGTSRLPGVS